MKNVLLVFAVLGFLSGLSSCTDSATTVVTNVMVVKPLTLSFAASDTLHTLSITHTCTCPFTWTVTELDSVGALILTGGTGDNTAVPVRVNRSLMKSDTLVTKVRVFSAFGIDTVNVTVYR